TANLVSGAMVVVLSVALPAVYSSADLRIAFAAPVAALASFAWLLRVCFERRDIAVGRMPVRALSFMLVAMIISSLFSDSIVSSWRETANFVVLIAFGLAVCDEFRQDDAARTHTLQLLVVVAALCGLMAVPQMVGLIPSQFPRWGTPFYRADLGFGQPNGLGLFLAMCLPLALQQVTVKQGGRKLL